MDNYVPSTYEEITDDLAGQWENWKGKNRNTVNIYNCKEDCLRDWWALHSGIKLPKISRTKYNGKLSKKIFVETPTGWYIFFTQEPFEYFQLKESRDKQWNDYKQYNGKMIRLYDNINDCIIERNDIIASIAT